MCNNTSPILCEIKTPIFKNNQIYKWKIQIGRFYPNDLMFITENWIDGFDVQFNSMTEWKDSVVRLIER